MIWIILFLMLASSGTAYAAEVSLRLDKSVLYPSDTVIVSGTADPNTWLTLKVLDSLGNICVFDATLTDDLGNYSIPFIAPDSPDGYTVVAGYGNKTGTQSFQIRPLPGSDDSSGGGNDGGGSTDGDGNGGSGSTGGGGGSSITPATPTNEATVSGTGISETSLPVNVNTQTGNAATDLGPLAEDIFSGTGTAVLTVPSIPDVSSYTVGIPAASLSGSQGEGVLIFSTDVGSITIPSGMLAGMPGTEGKKAGITIGQGDKSSLSEDVQDAIGDRPLIQLTLTLDGKQAEWNNPSTPVTVSIPYTPTAAELADPEHIVVWYIDGSGNVVSVPNGRYDPTTGTVTFITTHFSHYAVAYVHKTFGDLGGVERFFNVQRTLITCES